MLKPSDGTVQLHCTRTYGSVIMTSKFEKSFSGYNFFDIVRPTLIRPSFLTGQNKKAHNMDFVARPIRIWRTKKWDCSVQKQYNTIPILYGFAIVKFGIQFRIFLWWYGIILSAYHIIVREEYIIKNCYLTVLEV